MLAASMKFAYRRAFGQSISQHFMGLDLYIPPQERPGKGSFPTAPRKVKRWLAELSESNLRETTRLFFRGLDQLNHLEIATKKRLAIMEMLRPTGRLILDNLEKRFLALGLPLPEKTRRIFDLNITMLQNLAIGYKAVLVDAANGNGRLGGKSVALAVQRAMSYLTEIMVRSAQVYSPLPKNLWQDLNRLYAHAEAQGVENLAVRDPELHQSKKFSPQRTYLRAAMFALARPESLRRGDAERVYAVLETWSRECSLTPNFLERSENGVFIADVTGATPPAYANFNHNQTSPGARFVDLRPALDKVRESKEHVEEVESPLAARTSLSPSALRRLEMNWGMSSERISKRAKKARHAAVEVGLKNIHNRIMDEFGESNGNGKENHHGIELTLQSISHDQRRALERDGYITHPDHKELDEGPDVWELVSSGNALTAAYREELERKRRTGGKLIELPTTQEWKLTDVSAGGYGLRWEGDSPSKAHVGEVVGLRELQRGTYAQWRIGVIRWMQFINEHSFEVGIQALSPHGMAVLVERRQSSRNGYAQECLVLPEIKPIGQSTSLLAPAHMFRTGETVKVQIFSKDMLVKLTGVVEHTGSFTQFTIEAADIPQVAGNKSAREPGDVDSEVWSWI